VKILTKNPKPLPKKSLMKDAMRLLPNFPTFSSTHGSYKGSAAVLLIDAGNLNCKEREALAILYKAIPNRFYADLRTKQQTGYLVQTFPSVLVSHHNVLYFLVQSTKYLPGDLLKRFQTFITATLKDLKSGKSKTISKKAFNMIRGAKLAAYKTPNQTIKSMTSLMQTLLENYNGDFQTMEKKQALTHSMSYKDILAVGSKVFSPKNKRQLAVVYTNDGTKLDQLPAHFKKFSPKVGHMVGKGTFKCPINLGGKSNKSSPSSRGMPSPKNTPKPKRMASRPIKAPVAAVDVSTKLANMTDRNCGLKSKLGELQARESQLHQTLKEEIRELIAVLERAPLRRSPTEADAQ